MGGNEYRMKDGYYQTLLGGFGTSECWQGSPRKLTFKKKCHPIKAPDMEIKPHHKKYVKDGKEKETKMKGSCSEVKKKYMEQFTLHRTKR